MFKNFPDTVAAWQETQTAQSPADNLFHPSVRVQLSWSDIEDAVARGAVVPEQAHALWAFWASSDSPQRLAATAGSHRSESESGRTSAWSSLFARL